ncbi:MAG: response regulator [Pseudolabrys sp.]|nr:response regulator [Pseudolabrys sp.]
MTTDFVSLCLVVVSATNSVRETWRRGAGLASVPIDFFGGDAAEARARLAKGGIDLLILDAALPENELAGLVAAAKTSAPRPFVIGAGSKSRMEGLDATVAKPADNEGARLLVERCVKTRLPQRLLIVDDSGTMRGIVRKILSASRYALQVSEAEEGIGALKKLNETAVDIVMLDYNMPGFNGLETLAEIKRLAPKVSVIMMSSTLDSAVAERAQAQGAAFLKKPFYPADVDAIFDRLYGFTAS